MNKTLGVAITTLNRRNIFQQAITNVVKYTPFDTPIVVVDDGSDAQIRPDILAGGNVTLIRHTRPQGIARAKNVCIKELMRKRVEHLFLLDDDCWPIENDWWRPYVESRNQHMIHQPNGLNRCWQCRKQTWHIYDTLAGRYACSACDPAVKPYAADDVAFAPQWGAGIMLYMDADVVRHVGGMRPEFNRWSCETWEYSCRIQHTLGTPFPFVSFRRNYFHSVDAATTGRRSCLDSQTRNDHRQRNWDLFQKFKDTTDFVPYTEGAKVTVAPTELPTAAVCVPWRPTADRLPAFERCSKHWADNGFEVYMSDSDPTKPFLCGAARNKAARDSGADIVIIADGDTIPQEIEQIHEAIEYVAEHEDSVVWPFTTYRHIPASAVVMTHESLWGVTAVKEYRHGSPGGIIVCKAETLWKIGGFDERFVPGAWGFDDTAFQLAARTLAHEHRLPGIVYSFDHSVDSSGFSGRDLSDRNPNKARYRLYEMCCGKADLMKEVIKGNVQEGHS